MSEFVGQKAVHASQIEVRNQMFTSSSEDVQQAREVVVDGTFHDTAIVEQYRTVVARHEEVDA